MGQVTYVYQVYPQPVQTLEEADARILWTGWNLRKSNLARSFIDTHNVGEGSPDINAYSVHRLDLTARELEDQ